MEFISWGRATSVQKRMAPGRGKAKKRIGRWAGLGGRESSKSLKKKWKRTTEVGPRTYKIGGGGKKTTRHHLKKESKNENG